MRTSLTSETSTSSILAFSFSVSPAWILANGGDVQGRLTDRPQIKSLYREIHGTTTIETAHNNQLISIRDQLVSQMETIPFAMIDDEAVIAEIRALVVQEVEAAFQRRE